MTTLPTSPTHCVFIADDDEDDRFLIELAFSRHCPQAKLCFSVDGRELLDTLANSRLEPCLILLDLNMPRLNGFETLATLRQTPAFAQVPIVILTTSDGQADRERASELGATNYLVKPLHLEALSETVKQLALDWKLADCH